ncbi:unnamed protein product [Discosporangium mesarthrocarpum]
MQRRLVRRLREMGGKVVAGQWAFRLGLHADREFQSEVACAEAREAKAGPGSALRSDGGGDNCPFSEAGERHRGERDIRVGASGSPPLYLSLPLESDRVIDVSDMRGLALARAVLLESSAGPVPEIGIDVEWRPYSFRSSSRRPKNKVSLLQVACHSHVFLFDLKALEKGWTAQGCGGVSSLSEGDEGSRSPSSPASRQQHIRGVTEEKEGKGASTASFLPASSRPNPSFPSCSTPTPNRPIALPAAAASETSKALRLLVAEILGSVHVAKVGYGLEGDLKRLAESYPEEDRGTPGNSAYSMEAVRGRVIDLAYPGNIVRLGLGLGGVRGAGGDDDTGGVRKRPARRGLSGVVEEALGVGLDKAMQTSDWERRPLSEEQKAYAALDAYCTLMVVASGGSGGSGGGRGVAAATSRRGDG